MKAKRTKLGPLEIQLLSFAQFRKKDIIKTGEVASALGISAKQERELLSRMAKVGIIIRLIRGVYLVPPRMPSGGTWAVSEYFILSKLMKVLNGKYQISGPNAFRFYGFDDQISNRVYVYNNRISGERKIGNIEFLFIKTSDKRLGGVNKFKTADGSQAIMASKSRSLLDAVYDWNRYNTLPRAYKWITEENNKDHKLIDDLIEMAVKYGNRSSVRRIGYLLESACANTTKLARLKRKKGSSKSFIPWIPGKSSKGAVNRDWGLIINGEIWQSIA